jgi:hypothetical protein
MARIWPVYEGREPTRDGPWAELPFSEAVNLFELSPSDFISEIETTPRFGDRDRDLWFHGFKHIIVEVDRGEARREKWKAGFYRSKVKPKDALPRLLRHALRPDLGPNDIVRVDYEPTTDSEGSGAVKVTIVIAPEATKKLSEDGVALNALVRLQEQIRQIARDRTPIVAYATEAELEQGADS